VKPGHACYTTNQLLPICDRKALCGFSRDCFYILGKTETSRLSELCVFPVTLRARGAGSLLAPCPRPSGGAPLPPPAPDFCCSCVLKTNVRIFTSHSVPYSRSRELSTSRGHGLPHGVTVTLQRRFCEEHRTDAVRGTLPGCSTRGPRPHLRESFHFLKV